MDMKRILQAVDGVATKPVVGADSMARFLRVVDEAAINQLPAVKVPPVPALPAQDGDQGDGTMVTDRGDGTKTFSTATGTFTYDAQGKAIKFKTPNIGGLGQTIDLVTGNTENNYDQGPASIQQKNDAQGNLISNRIRADLGPTSIQTKQYASGVTKLTAQGDGADSIVGVDASAKRLGVDPDKFAAFQQQLPANESLNKFLSIIDKNDVSVLNEGKNPHKVALPVQMAMQHYQQQESIPVGHRPRVIDRYFQQADQEFTERKEEKRALMHQYASIIAERVLMKESEQGVAEGNEWQGNRGNSQAGITDHTFDEAKQYIKGNYPFHKTYNVSRVEPGMRYHANPEKVANKTQSLVKGIDSALDYLQVKQNPMMSGSTQVTPSIGYSWHTHESRANGIAVLYYEDRGMGNDTITIAAKDRNNLKGAVQVCRDAGVIPLPKVKEQGVAEGSEIKIPTEDGITMQDIRLMAGDGPLTKKTILQAIAVIRKQRRPQGVAEGEYDSRKPFGVRYKVFAGREGRMTTKEYWTSSEEKLQRAVDKIQALNNFYEIDGYSYPKEQQGVAEGSEQKPAITYKDYTLQYDYQTEDDDPEGYSTATTYYFDVLKDGDRVGEAEYFDYFGNLTIRINGKTKEFGFRHPLASQISQLVSSLPDEQKKDLSDPKFESQGVAEGSEKRCMQCGMTNCSCKPGTCKCKPIKGWTPGKGFKKIKEAGESGWTRNGMAGVGLQSNAPDGGHLSLGETPIEMDPAEPNNPMVRGHQGANSMSLKGRIQQARAQLTELAELAQSDNLIVWEGICKKAKGGVFMGLEQNLEQIRHGIHELAAKRKRGGASSRGIDRNIG